MTGAVSTLSQYHSDILFINQEKYISCTKRRMEVDHYVQTSVVLRLAFYLTCSLRGTWLNGMNRCSGQDYMHGKGFRLCRSPACISPWAKAPSISSSAGSTLIFLCFLSMICRAYWTSVSHKGRVGLMLAWGRERHPSSTEFLLTLQMPTTLGKKIIIFKMKGEGHKKTGEWILQHYERLW